MDGVSVVTLGPQAVLGMRRKGSSREISQMMGRICRYAAESGVHLKGPAYVVRIGKEAGDCGTDDLEVCCGLWKDVEGYRDVKCYDLAGGKMAKIVHMGPYGECARSYDRLASWMRRNKKSLAGPYREAHAIGHCPGPGVEECFEIYAPIR